jgi:transcriptional regulator with XRE-family HTH domain
MVEYKQTRPALSEFLQELLARKGLNANRLAAELCVSHATVSRWLSGADIPSLASCQKLAVFACVPLERFLTIAGYLAEETDESELALPEFREYARRKYSRELDDDLITMIEDLIERRRRRQKDNGGARNFPAPCAVGVVGGGGWQPVSQVGTLPAEAVPRVVPERPARPHVHRAARQNLIAGSG